jgi:ParB family chromosome partitioning protein
MMTEIVEIPIDKIDLLYAREEVDEKEIVELAESIRSLGLAQLPLVRFDKKTGRYQLIVGTRRYLAVKRLGLEKLQARLVDVDEVRARALSLVENVQRKDLSDMELAKRLRELKELGKYSAKELAALLGKSEGWVLDHLRMVEPIEEGVRKACEEVKPTAISIARAMEMVIDRITSKHAKALLKQEEPVRTQLFKEIVKEAVEKGTIPSARTLERRAEELRKELARPKEVPVESIQEPRPTTAPTPVEEEEGEEEGVRVLYRKVVRGAEEINKAFEEFKQMLERGTISAGVESGEERPSVQPSTRAEPTSGAEIEALERTAVVTERPTPSAEEAATTINDLLLKLNDVLERLRLSAATLIGRRVRAVFEHPYEEGEEDAVTGTLTRADRRAVYVEVALGGGSKAERMIRWYELKRIELV